MPELTAGQLFELVDAMLVLPDIASPARRQSIVDRLPTSLRSAVSADPAARPHLANIVTACVGYADGLDILHAILSFYYREAIAFGPVSDRLTRCAHVLSSRTAASYAPNELAIQRYLEGLIEYASDYLRLRQPVSLSARDTRSALRHVFRHMNRIGSPALPASAAAARTTRPDREFTSFDEAFTSCSHRMLLLGEPGAGKSTTLHEVALAAAEARQQDPSRPVPIFVPIDEIKEHRFNQLPPDSLPPLLQNHAAENGAEIFQGRPLLYILDGLDEIGGERPVDLKKPEGETFDPRAEFLQCVQQQLPAEPLVVACRVTDYNQIREKVLLPGAVTLLPLTDQKIKEFLFDKQNQPHIWATLETDPALLNLARTPLHLALLSGAAGDNKEPINLNSAGGLIDLYIDRRYEHEASNHALPFTLPVTRTLLSTIAQRMWRMPHNPERSLTDRTINEALGQDSSRFLPFCRTLQLLVPSSDQAAWEFPHLAFRDHMAIPALIAALGNTVEGVRDSAATALGKIGPAASGAIPALTIMLRDDHYVRRSAANALAGIGPAGIPALIAAEQGSGEYEREAAEYALDLIASSGAEIISALITALGDTNAEVRISATASLRHFGPAASKAIPALIASLRKDRHVHMYAASALGKIGPTAIPALIATLGDAESNARSGSAFALAAIGRASAEAIPALITTLGDAEPVVRRAAATALGSMGPASAAAISALTAVLRDADADVRTSAATALGKIGPAAIPALIAALGDANAEVRRSVATALAGIGPASAEAIPALVVALKDPDADVRKSATSALRGIGTKGQEALKGFREQQREP